MKTGIVDVGGGLRGVYAAGIFDRCLDLGIQFDLCIGVSAGSANVSAFLAGQRKRNYAFYTEYPFRRRYMSFENFLFKRSYLDLDYVYGTLSSSDGENPLDYQALCQNPAELVVVASNAVTGEVRYFQKQDMEQDRYDILKASSAIPFVCHPYKVYDVPYFDGALSDPVPVKKAFQEGCERVVLILSKPLGKPRTAGTDMKFADRIQRKYPLAAENLRERAERYNRSVDFARRCETQRRVLIVAPDDTCGVDTLTKNRDALKKLYEKGYQDGQSILDFVRSEPYN